MLHNMEDSFVLLSRSTFLLISVWFCLLHDISLCCTHPTLVGNFIVQATSVVLSPNGKLTTPSLPLQPTLPPCCLTSSTVPLISKQQKCRTFRSLLYPSLSSFPKTSNTSTTTPLLLFSSPSSKASSLPPSFSRLLSCRMNTRRNRRRRPLESSTGATSSGASPATKKKPSARNSPLSSSRLSNRPITSLLLRCRNFLSILRQYINSIPPVTRVYLFSSFLLSALHSIEVLTPEDLAFHPGRTIRALELWRPFSAALFPGDFSLSTISNLYMFLSFAKDLEISSGSADHLVFLLTQTLLLTAASWWLRLPFFASSLWASAVYVRSRSDPYRQVGLLFGLQVEQWKLPFASIAIDIVHAQNIRAGLPGLLGVISGQIYYSLKEDLPRLVGCCPSVVTAPTFLKQLMDAKPSFGVTDYRMGSSKRRNNREQTTTGRRKNWLSRWWRAESHDDGVGEEGGVEDAGFEDWKDEEADGGSRWLQEDGQMPPNKVAEVTEDKEPQQPNGNNGTFESERIGDRAEGRLSSADKKRKEQQDGEGREEDSSKAT
eukprot:GHVS01096270.1.p1 GENE.GHVS01096270.1~~GHVS01096270.1.p1  ORF type:complete len:545 (+),score=105.80 GHVS01096270.1:24-1658(+)